MFYRDSGSDEDDEKFSQVAVSGADILMGGQGAFAKGELNCPPNPASFQIWQNVQRTATLDNRKNQFVLQALIC